MSEEATSAGGSIGTARIDVTVNTATMESGVEAAKRKVSGLGDQAAQEFDKANASTKRYAESLLRQADLLGKTRAEQIAYNAQTRIGGELGNKIAAAALRQQDALHKAADGARELAESLSSASFNDAQLLKANAALGIYKGKAEAAAAAAEKLKRDAFDSATFNDAQLLKVNAALATYTAKASAAAEAARELAAAQRADSARTEGASRLEREAAIQQKIFAQTAQQLQRQEVLRKMRQDATAAFGPEFAAYERERAEIQRSNAVRDRLAAFLNTERGARIAAAEGIAKQAAQYSTAATAAGRYGAAFKTTAKSAGELQFALRSLPAQITDIVTGLATGQRPLTVLLQQGGQLKDLFGGVAPAAKALGSSLLGLINPLTVAGGLLAGLGYSLYQVDADAAKDRETLKGFQQALNGTGNAAGETAQGLAALSEQLGHGAEQATAYGAVLKELVGGGFILGPSLGKVAQEVQSISEATGKTAGQVVSDYQKIFKDPAGAAAELSQTIQFLSADQFALVQQLEATGEKGRAANIVISALNDALTGGTDSAKKYASKLAEISRQLDDIRNHPEKYNAGDLGGFSTSDALTSDLEAQRKQNVAAYVTASLNEQNRQLAAGARESIAAQQRLSAFASPQDKLKSTLAQANKDRLAALYGVVDPAARARIEAEYKGQVKAANDAFDSATKERKTRQKKSPEASAFATLQSQVDALQVKNITGDNSALTQYERGIRKLADDMAAYLAGSGDATKAAAEFNRGQQALAETLARAKQQETDAERAYAAALEKSNQALADQVNAEVERIGSGQKEFERSQQLTRAYQDQAAALAELALKRQMGIDGKAGGISQDQYDADVSALRSATEEKVRILKDGFRRQDAAQADWLNGAKASYQDYVDQAADVAGQTYDLFNNAFTGLGDALATFVTTGKLNFKGLVSSILSDLAKMETRILASQILQSIVGSIAGGYGGTNGQGGVTYNSQGFVNHVYAKGGVVDGSRNLSAYSGQVVDRPTVFAFAKGNGLMGEAGPEAIMPLRRGPDGRLGVAAAGGSSSGDVQLSQTFVIDGSGTNEQSRGAGDDNLRKFTGRMKDAARQVILEEQRPGGSLWRMRQPA